MILLSPEIEDLSFWQFVKMMWGIGVLQKFLWATAIFIASICLCEIWLKWREKTNRQVSEAAASAIELVRFSVPLLYTVLIVCLHYFA